MGKLLLQIFVASLILAFVRAPQFLFEEKHLPILNSEFSPNQVLVKFSPDLSNDIQKRTIRRADATTIAEIPVIGATVLEVPEGEVEVTIDELIQQTGVIYAEPNYYMEATDIIPNDPGWGNQYNLAAIHAPAGWTLNTGEVWVTIAILDTGIELSHPDLFVRILPGYDFVNNDNDPQDDNGHGTHVAAIAAASSNNGVGISGVNWGANLLPVKVLNASGNGTYANTAAGIVWATDHGTQVINLSLGGPSPSFVLNDAINYAYNHGVILVASTGNAGAHAVLYPAAYDPVIAVGATDSTNAWAGFSNYGPDIDVVAPGVSIYSAFPDGGYGYRSGTSMAAPHVSGLAAILWGIPGNGPARVRTIIENTTLDLGPIGWDEQFGNGLIQMDKAIQLALPIATFTPTGTVLPAQAEMHEESQGYSYSPPLQIGVSNFTATITQTISSSEIISTLPPPSTAAETMDVSAFANITPTSTAQTASTDKKEDISWLGCWGVFLTLIGILLFWFGSRNSGKKYRRKSLWKT